MSEKKLVRRAKVTLKGAKSYKVGSKKFIKDEPELVKGSMVDEIEKNGRFKCVILESKEVSKKKSSSGKKSSKKKVAKKSSSKKKASKKVSSKKSK